MRGIDAVLEEIPGGLYDVRIGWDGDLETADSFDTYIVVALLTDARADAADVLEPSRRRGWAGDEAMPGFGIGSKLWLYDQARLTRTTLNAVSEAAVEALQSLVEDGHAIAIRTVEVRATASGVYLEVEIEKPQSTVEHRLFELWAATGRS